jgi:hypothetical protein
MLIAATSLSPAIPGITDCSLFGVGAPHFLVGSRGSSLPCSESGLLTWFCARTRGLVCRLRRGVAPRVLREVVLKTSDGPAGDATKAKCEQRIGEEQYLEIECAPPAEVTAVHAGRRGDAGIPLRGMAEIGHVPKGLLRGPGGAYRLDDVSLLILALNSDVVAVEHAGSR